AEIALQLEEIAAGFQIGVILGQREQPAERSRQRAFGLRTLRDVALRQRLRRRAHLRDFLEHAALVRRVALDGLHQVTDQVGAALELDVDAAPGLVRHLARAHQPVEGDGGVEHHRQDNCDDDPGEHGYWSPLLPWRFTATKRGSPPRRFAGGGNSSAEQLHYTLPPPAVASQAAPQAFASSRTRR